MNKIYHVVINGKTFESHNLKQLLSKAVAEKRSAPRVKTAPSSIVASKIVVFGEKFQSVAI